MAIYYVKAGGTATGDAGRETVARTGSFADMGVSSYYDNLKDIFAGGVPTTAFANGDSAYVSDVHYKEYSASFTNMDIMVDFFLISVQDLNCDKYTTILDGTGAIEQVGSGSGTADFLIIDEADITGVIRGVSFICASDQLIIAYKDDNHIIISDCQITSRTKSTKLSSISGYFNLDNVLLGRTVPEVILSADPPIGSYFLKNCRHQAKYQHRMIDSVSFVMHFEEIGGDYSACDPSGAFLENVNQDAHGFNFYLSNCLFPSATWLFTDNIITSDNIAIIADACHDADGAFFSRLVNVYGKQITTESTVLNATYDGTNKFASSVASSALATFDKPFKVKVGVMPAQNLTTSKTFEVELTCANTLTNKDFWIELERPNGTNETLSVTQSTRIVDIIANASPITTSLAAWTNPLANKYKCSITIPTLAGVDNGMVTIWALLAKPSETIIIDPAVTVT